MQQVASPTVASPGRRLLAFVIDIIILTLLGIPVLAAFGDTSELKPGQVDATVLAVGMFVTASYHVFFLCTMSATLGKMAMHLYVSDREGNRIRPDTAILRYLVYLVGQLVMVGMFLSAALVLTDPRRRAVHDRVAGTLVVVGRPPGFE
jgi:uncharacterized RDD family membrane protein YckC